MGVEALGCVDCLSANHAKNRVPSTSSLLSRSPAHSGFYSMSSDDLRFSEGQSGKETRSSHDLSTYQSEFSEPENTDQPSRLKVYDHSASKKTHQDLREQRTLDSDATDTLLKEMGWSIIIVHDAKGIGSYPFQRLYTAPDGKCFQSRESALTYLGIPFQGNRESFIRWEV
ncbi:hypothetical protein GUITHDRAFT_100507 [Guillardia theta CCMP2712]|uniref:Uncharacterized protein n=1 Tax=Guillardia theta (strain CCMP2712) TaxID=905079 RepID=L1K142_GUITC|nr:hypothetical protein GUITHDRAFT_100507 [Guillardia theta CCMP2712]EKX54264.1 hypothetical protein GUITHDRAFT_100507 [Guillardia theta CCMP2712]|eukprot:XP_005841244.1 hypothetical protein GUITHDRAFT_100507 [Guillardia theta CCMP2712]